MKPEVERSLIARVLARCEAGSTDAMPGVARAKCVDYVSPSRFDLERRALFHRVPVFVSTSAAVSAPGDFATLDEYGMPLLVTRDAAGRARVFVNACRHRGTRLVHETHGRNRASFVCPYHAWVYGGDGRLLKIAHDECFPGVDRAEHGLVELPSAERMGIVWAVLDPSSRVDFDAFLGPVAAEIDALGLVRHVEYKPHSHVYRTNWKVLVDGAVESYHFRALHRRTIAPVFFDNVLVYDRFAPHQRHILPRRGIEALASGGCGGLLSNAHVVYYVFPNTVFLLQHDHTVLVVLQPREPGATRVTVTMLVPEAPGAGDEKAEDHWEKNRQITLATLAEDFGAAEWAYDGMRSGAIAEILFGTNELGIADFHASLDEALARA